MDIIIKIPADIRFCSPCGLLYLKKGIIFIIHQIFIKVNYFENEIASGQNEKFVLLSAKVKSFAHLFKGGRGRGGGATLSSLPQW